MTVGTMGDVTFEVSSNTVRTFNNLKWSSKANYSTHALHMKSGMLEMTGYDPDEAQFDMFLSALLGESPYTTLNKLQKLLKDGTIVSLVLGTDVIGDRWVITEISRAFKHLYKDGSLISCEVSVKLKQYV